MRNSSVYLVNLIYCMQHFYNYGTFQSYVFSSKKCLGSNEYQLVFAVKKDTDSTKFWKATIQVACIKICPMSQKVSTFRLLTLQEFLKVFKTLKCQINAVEQCKR